MKKITNIILIASIFFSSCISLEEETYSDLSKDKIYQNTNDADAAVMGIYSDWINNSTFAFLQMLGSTTTTADTRYTYIVANGPTQETSHVLEFWSGYYRIVRKANEVIQNLWESKLEDSKKTPYIAEAIALRTYAYFQLVKLWGDIPFRIAEKDSWNSEFTLTPMEAVYRQLIGDMEWAISNGWKEGAMPRGRIDKIGSQMLLSDIYLTCASSANAYNASTTARALKPYYIAFSDDKEIFWKRVKVLSANVIKSNYYKLETKNWSNLWGYSKEFDSRFNKEHIWTTQVIPGVFGSKTYLRFTPSYSNYCPGQLVGETFMTYNWATSFDRSDKRFTDGIIWEYNDMRYFPNTNGKYYVEKWRRDINNQKSVLNGTDKTIADTIWRYSAYQRLQTKKFYDKSYLVANNSVGPAVQMPFYRMAEAYLFYAEAENELFGCTQDAVNMINPIRIRAGLQPYTQAQFSREELREKIIDERLWEFAMEGKDIFDIMRTGKLAERCSGKEVLWDGQLVPGVEPRARTSDSYWLPYPKAERDTNKALKEITRMNYE